MRSLQPTLPEIFGSEPPTDPKAAAWEDDEVTVVKDHDHDSGRHPAGGLADDDSGGRAEAELADADDVTVAKGEDDSADDDEVTAVAKVSDLKFSLKSAGTMAPTSLGEPDGDDEAEEAVPTAPRPHAPPPPPPSRLDALPTAPRAPSPPPPPLPPTSRLPLTTRAPVPPPPTRPPARKSAPPPPPTIRSAARDSARPPPPPEPSVATPGPARTLLLRPPPSDEALTPPPRPNIPPPPPSSRTTYVPPSLPPRGRLKLDSIDRLPSIGLSPAQLAAAQAFNHMPAFNPSATVPKIPPPPALPKSLTPASNPPPALSLAPTSLSSPPPASWALGRPLRASGIAVAAGLVLGACLTLVVLALSKRGPVAGGDAELVMTAAGANGATLRGVELFVNGERRCSQMPCRVEGVGSGAHLVRLTVREAPKATPHLTPDQLPASDDRPEPSLEDKRARAKAREAAAVPPAAPPAEAKATQAPSSTEAPTPPAAAAPEAPATRGNASNAAASSRSQAVASATTAPAAPLGTIHVTSNIPANVVVDGRVLGRAPRSIRVSSGVHTVVVAGAKGRRVQSIRIEKGRTRRVSARF